MPAMTLLPLCRTAAMWLTAYWLPTVSRCNYLGLGNSSLFVFNPSFAIDQQFDAIIHQHGPTVDFTISDPNLDLMYYEASSGGHNTLGALDSPEPYEWLLSHSLAEPEPTALC